MLLERHAVAQEAEVGDSELLAAVEVGHVREARAVWFAVAVELRPEGKDDCEMVVAAWAVAPLLAEERAQHHVLDSLLQSHRAS
jgi:hypothetical protein